MNINLIKMYISKIKKNDIESFLNKNKIKVTEKELDYLYDVLKNRYINILNEDQDTFNDIKNNISKNNYKKLFNLYYKYKELYLK